MPTSPYDLVIFDCDGVLVDSELLSAKVLMSQLSETGIDLSFDDFRRHFLGRKFGVAVAQLSVRTQKHLPEDFQNLYFERLLSVFETELQPMSGVQNLLKSMAVDYCVASSSAPQRLECAMRVCGLQDFFGNRVFSAAEVKNAKPAPDLFLHAARTHKVAPSRCLVIEDSEMGIMAANAAAMDVWQFTGGSHMNSAYHLPDGLTIRHSVADMQRLLELFQQVGLSQSTVDIEMSGAHSYGA